MKTRMKIPTKIRKTRTKVITREVCTQANPTKTGLNLKVTKTPTKILKIPTKILKIPTRTQKIRTRTRKETRMERAITENTEIRNSTTGKTMRRKLKILKTRWRRKKK